MSGTVIYQSGMVFGHQNIHGSNNPNIFVCSLQGAGLPKENYRIMNARIEVTLRNANWGTLSFYTDSGHLGDMGIEGIGGDRWTDISTTYAYPNGDIHVKMHTSSPGVQLQGGSTVKIILTWEIVNAASTFVLDKQYVYTVAKGDGLTATITPFKPSYRHVFAIVCNSRIQYTEAVLGVTSARLTIPDAWLGEIPNAMQAAAWVKLYSYDGNTLVGESDFQYFYIVVHPDYKPIIQASFSPSFGTNYNPGNNVYIQNKCGVQVNLTQISSWHGATIASVQINTSLSGRDYQWSGAGPTVFTTGPLYQAGATTVTITAVDSRGQTAQMQQVLSVQNYTPPMILAVQAERVQDAFTPNASGLLGRVGVSWNWDNQVNGNIALMSISWREKGTSNWTESYQGTALSHWTMLTAGGTNAILDKNKVYQVQVKAWDRYEQTERIEEIQSANYVMSFLPSGTGVAVGKAVEYANAFEVAPHLEAYFYGKTLESMLRGKAELKRLWSGAWASGSITLSETSANYQLLVVGSALGIAMIPVENIAQAIIHWMWNNNGAFYPGDNRYVFNISGKNITLATARKYLNGNYIGEGDPISFVIGLK